MIAEGHVAWVPCATEEVDLHAGFTETSLMLHLRPEAVRLDRPRPGTPSRSRRSCPLLMAGGVGAVSANGVLGDPPAPRPRGERVLAEMVADAGQRIRDGCPMPAACSRGQRSATRMSRVALVTGAARGIGAATVRTLVATGTASSPSTRAPETTCMTVSRTRWPPAPSSMPWPRSSPTRCCGRRRTRPDALAALPPTRSTRWGRLDAAVAAAAVIAGGRRCGRRPDAQLDALGRRRPRGLEHRRRRRSRTCSPARPVRLPVRRGGLGRRDARTVPPRGLQRRQARRRRPGEGARRRPGRHRGHRRARSRPARRGRRMLDATAELYGLADPDEFAATSSAPGARAGRGRRDDRASAARSRGQRSTARGPRRRRLPADDPARTASASGWHRASAYTTAAAPWSAARRSGCSTSARRAPALVRDGTLVVADSDHRPARRAAARLRDGRTRRGPARRRRRSTKSPSSSRSATAPTGLDRLLAGLGRHARGRRRRRLAATRSGRRGGRTARRRLRPAAPQRRPGRRPQRGARARCARRTSRSSTPTSSSTPRAAAAGRPLRRPAGRGGRARGCRASAQRRPRRFERWDVDGLSLDLGP